MAAGGAGQVNGVGAGLGNGTGTGMGVVGGGKFARGVSEDPRVSLELPSLPFTFTSSFSRPRC